MEQLDRASMNLRRARHPGGPRRAIMIRHATP
jgi:hypothetical protein